MDYSYLKDLKFQDWISLLRLGMDGWKMFGTDRFKDKKTPEKVRELLEKAEKEVPNNINEAEIDRRLALALDPTDAITVKSDLELLSLFAVPTPSLDAFDYWSQLTSLVKGLQTYAINNRLFELRGVKGKNYGEMLLLPTSGECLLPNDHAERLAMVASPHERLKDAKCNAVLCKLPGDFPVIAAVEARFEEYSEYGGEPSIKTRGCDFFISSGQQRHWLKFVRPDEYYPYFRGMHQYMLEAADMISIAQALRDDIRKYSEELHADEEIIKPLFASIDAFKKKLSAPM